MSRTRAPHVESFWGSPSAASHRSATAMVPDPLGLRRVGRLHVRDGGRGEFLGSDLDALCASPSATFPLKVRVAGGHSIDDESWFGERVEDVARILQRDALQSTGRADRKG